MITPYKSEYYVTARGGLGTYYLCLNTLGHYSMAYNYYSGHVSFNNIKHARAMVEQMKRWYKGLHEFKVVKKKLFNPLAIV